MLALSELLEEKKNIVWDWNGTLLNDVALCVEIINAVLSDHGLGPIDLHDYRSRFRFPVKDYYSSLGFDFGKTPFEVVAADFMRRYNEQVVNCSLFDDCVELLKGLNAKSKTQVILSAARESDIRELIRHHGIERELRAVYGLGDHFARSKVERGQEMIREQGWRLEETVLVGDTDHDIEVAGALGIDALILADGHQHPEHLVNIHENVLLCRFTGRRPIRRGTSSGNL